jgi:uncharacterized protein (TIGR03083 family)
VSDMALDYLTHLRNDSARALRVLRDADPGLPVPSCPGWSADDLLWHLAEVQWFWGTIVQQRLQDPDRAEEQKPDRPGSHDALVAFFEESTKLLQSTLAATEPTVEVWMWADDKSVGYIRRRQAHEALIHRLDAELTVGDVSPLDPDLASDGVHEALTVMYGGVPAWGTFSPSGRTIEVVTTDTGLSIPLQLGRWAGTSPNTGTSYDEPICEIADADGFEAEAVVRGSAPALDTWVWGRSDERGLAVEGDREVFDQLQEVVSQGIQ